MSRQNYPNDVENTRPDKLQHWTKIAGDYIIIMPTCKTLGNRVYIMIYPCLKQNKLPSYNNVTYNIFIKIFQIINPNKS